jgi:hypothetical protein
VWSEYSSIAQVVADSFPAQYKHYLVCRNMPVCIGSGFFLINICVYLENKKYISYPLSRINNTSLTSKHFELDNRECECLVYYISANTITHQ